MHFFIKGFKYNDFVFGNKNKNIMTLNLWGSGFSRCLEFMVSGFECFSKGFISSIVETRI